MKHDFPFDPTYGYDLGQLKCVEAPEEPTDFAKFWTDLFHRTRQISPHITRRRCTAFNHPQIDVFEIEFNSLDRFRVGGWLTIPKTGVVNRGIIVGHGYGGRTEPELVVANPPSAMIFPCGRGFNRSAHADIPGESSSHVLHGIQSRDNYLHGKCAADIWAAATVLLDLFPQVAGDLLYRGASFGGGIGAMAVPWDHRIRAACLDVPSFGNHPLRLTLRCIGSGEFVRHYSRHHPEVIQVLRYFDSATAASETYKPVVVAAALFDPAVPPPGQFSVYNSLRGPKRLFVREAAHFAWAGQLAEDDVLRDAVEDFFSFAPTDLNNKKANGE